MGASNIDVCKNFPDKYQAMLSVGKNAKDISFFVTSYNKNKLVN